MALVIDNQTNFGNCIIITGTVEADDDILDFSDQVNKIFAIDFLYDTRATGIERVISLIQRDTKVRGKNLENNDLFFTENKIDNRDFGIIQGDTPIVIVRCGLNDRTAIRYPSKFTLIGRK